MKSRLSDFPAKIIKFDKLFFMKSKEEIKAELHKKIDSIEDEHTLNVLNDDIDRKSVV